MPRRRLSSDGFRLFNMAHMPEPSKIRQMLSCLFHSEYDDKLLEMTESCENASKQLFACSADPIKKTMVNKFIDNSIFNVIYAILSKDSRMAKAFEMRQNYRYFMDVLELAHDNGDHNTAIMLRAALEHHALKQMKFKMRKKDTQLLETLEEEYGTWRNCYKNHLQKMMNTTDMEIFPSMMVMQMHLARHKAYSTIGNCKLKYQPMYIQGKIGMYGIKYITENYEEILPLYEQPPVNKSADLILLAQQAR